MIIQALFLLFILFAFSRVVLRFKKHDVTSREFALWTFFWLGAGFVVLWPEVLSRIAVLVRVGRGVDVAIYASLLLIFYLLFRMFARIDRIERDITQLVRTTALDDQSSPVARSQKP